MFPALPSAANWLEIRAGHNDLGQSFLPAPRPELENVEGHQGCPASPAHSDPLTSLHLLEKTLTLPVTEEHRREGGKKGDKQIELGALLPGQGLERLPGIQA